MNIWKRKNDFGNISKSLLRKRVTKTVFFIYDMDPDDYSIVVALLRAEFSSHPDAESVKVTTKPWEGAVNIQFIWKDDIDETTRKEIEKRIRSTAVQYDAVLDKSEQKGI